MRFRLPRQQLKPVHSPVNMTAPVVVVVVAFVVVGVVDVVVANILLC